MQEDVIASFKQLYSHIEPSDHRPFSLSWAIRPSENQISSAWKELFEWRYKDENVLFKMFLEDISSDDLFIKAIGLLGNGCVPEVSTETPYIDDNNKNRRIDISVTVEDRASSERVEFLIESKARGASCQDGQREAYRNWVKRKPDSILIWIDQYDSGCDAVPAEESSFVRITCDLHIQKWLERCRQYLTGLELIDMAAQIDDFRRALPGGMDMSVDEIKKNEGKIWGDSAEAALTMLDNALNNSNYTDALLKEFKKKVISSLKEILGLAGMEFGWEQRRSAAGWSIKIVHPHHKRYALFIQFCRDETIIGWCPEDGTEIKNCPHPSFLPDDGRGQDPWYYGTPTRLKNDIYHPEKLIGLYNCYYFIRAFENKASENEASENEASEKKASEKRDKILGQIKNIWSKAGEG